MNNTVSQSYKKADKLVRQMSDEHLLSVWRAIRRNGLQHMEDRLVNNIYVDEWIEMVHSEVSTIRRLTR